MRYRHNASVNGAQAGKSGSPAVGAFLVYSGNLGAVAPEVPTSTPLLVGLRRFGLAGYLASSKVSDLPG
jgi:hypothetical protein